MTVAIWSGNSKPILNEYLLPFVTELKEVLTNGVKIGLNHIKLGFGRILADTPARSFIKGENICMK